MDDDMVLVELREMFTGDEEAIVVPRAAAQRPYPEWSEYETVGPGTWYAYSVRDYPYTRA
jgi:hypothetical protein